MVVNRLNKSTDFISLRHPFTTQGVAKAFVDNVVKLHGIPRNIITDRDSVFMSYFGGSCSRFKKVSSTYHPQADERTEVVNYTLE